jgi:Holliday junction DNA helicase RuvA
MIAHLAGTIAEKSGEGVVIDVAGVGYAVGAATGTIARLGAVGDKVLLYTYLHLRENEVALFGFADPEQRTAFLALITVSGIGPKVALAVLSALTPQLLANAVTTEDIATLSSVSGIGKKTAQRMIIELKGKIGASYATSSSSAAPVAPTSAVAEAQTALFAMGLTPVEVTEALVGADAGASTAEIVKHALKHLGGGI